MMHFLMLFEGCVASIPFIADSASVKLTSGVCRLYEANFAATYFMRSQMCPIHESVGTHSANELAIAVSLLRHRVSHVWNKTHKKYKQTKLSKLQCISPLYAPNILPANAARIGTPVFESTGCGPHGTKSEGKLI